MSRIKEILAEVKPLAAEYYRLTGKPLGVTGEIAEYAAAELLNLELAGARTEGYDAIRNTEDGPVRIQIKGRAFGIGSTRSQRLGKIKSDAPCDIVMLVLLSNDNLEAQEIWEAPFADVAERIAAPGSKARNRGALGVAEFKRIAQLVWSNQKPNIEKACPECGQPFAAGTWGGIDAHWRSRHEHIMPYEKARDSIMNGTYRKR